MIRRRVSPTPHPTRFALVRKAAGGGRCFVNTVRPSLPSRRPADLIAAASADMHMIQHHVKRCERNPAKRNDRKSLPDGRKRTQHPGLAEILRRPLRTLDLTRIVLLLNYTLDVRGRVFLSQTRKWTKGAARTAADTGQARVFTCSYSGPTKPLLIKSSSSACAAFIRSCFICCIFPLAVYAACYL